MGREQKIGAWIACLLASSAVTVGAVLAARDDQQLSELEKVKLELLQVKTAYASVLAQHDSCKAELGAAYNTLGKFRADAAGAELSADEAKLKAEIEASHDGFTWNPKTGVFTPKPEPPKGVK